MEKKNTPLSADEIISGLGLGKKKLRNDLEVIIRILSAEALTRKELLIRLRTDHECQDFTDKQLKQGIAAIRSCFGIISRQDNRYFINNSKVDPKFKGNVVNDVGKEFVAGRAIRSIMYEILKDTPLIVGQLAKAVEEHPDYDGSKGTGKKLLLVVNRHLHMPRDKKSFFERDDSRGSYNVWRVKPNSSPPPREAGGYQRRCKEDARPKRDALYQLMRARSIIKGWSFRDLFEAARQSNLKCANPEVTRVSFSRIFRQNQAYFECCSGGKSARWRARCLGTLKSLSCPDDFFDLAKHVLDDLALPVDLDYLLKVIYQHSHLFGYTTNELPKSFLQNSIVRAIVGTEYVKRIKS